MTHILKFNVWKESISNRLMLEMIFIGVITVIFQNKIMEYNS